jgi:16S rRNA (adenine(1408)-N(1))-methyltransferase
MDLGTGDGRAVLTEAAADPRALVVGIDADASAMAESSRRAARSIRRGGSPNAVFVASGVDRLPDELAAISGEVVVRFPWGSLLRGVLGLDPVMTSAIARLVASQGRLMVDVSLTARDAVDGRPPGAIGPNDLAAMAAAFGVHGLRLEDAHELTLRDAAALASTWARRLRVGTDRVAWRLRFRRDGDRDGHRDSDDPLG